MANRILDVKSGIDKNGVLKINDIVKNKLYGNDNIILRFPNTKGIDPTVLDGLDENVQISITGGLDYKKSKFNVDHYFNRTLYYPDELKVVIELFQEIEKGIDPKWTELQKAMYVYKKITEECHYTDKDEYVKAKDGTMRDNVRSYRGLKNRSLTCAGFALVYKEIMDRLGIKCHYCNRKGGHCWNTLEIDGKYIPVDLSDSCDLHHAKHDKSCQFHEFGSAGFYELLSNRGRVHHGIDPNDNEEIDFSKKLNIRYLTPEEIKSNLAVIAPPVVKKSNNGFRLIKFEGKTYNMFVIEKNKDWYQIGYIDNGVIKILILSAKQFAEFKKDGTEIKSYTSKSVANGYTRALGDKFYIASSLAGNDIYLYIEISKKIYPISSKNKLDMITNEDDKRRIADMLLSPARLERRVNEYGGYVGEISLNGFSYAMGNTPTKR